MVNNGLTQEEVQAIVEKGLTDANIPRNEFTRRAYARGRYDAYCSMGEKIKGARSNDQMQI
jgi:hypothetical protein